MRRAAETAELNERTVCDIAASFQAAAVEVLVERSKKAMRMLAGRGWPVRRLVVAGGVAANGLLNRSLVQSARDEGFELTIPPARLCTDNGAMVGWAGLERLSLGMVDELAAPARARWPLDADRANVAGAKS